MTWFKLDDTWLTHPKVQAAGLRARALWIAGGLHCAQHLTDGRIDHHLVPILAALAGVSNGTKEARAAMEPGHEGREEGSCGSPQDGRRVGRSCERSLEPA